MMNLFDLPSTEVSADIGSGPRCGIFQSYTSDIMYAVDPLWRSYKKENLHNVPSGVETVLGDAEIFSLPRSANLIVSINALDHSGSLAKSVDNIMSNVLPGGLFCLHIHMRTKKQLNKGHKMLITEPEIDDIFSQWEIVDKTIYEKCPIEDKPYKSYVAVVRKWHENSPSN